MYVCIKRAVVVTMWLTQTTSGQQENNVEVTNDSIADNPLRWMYTLVYGMSLIAILFFSTARSVVFIKVNLYYIALILQVKIAWVVFVFLKDMTFVSLLSAVMVTTVLYTDSFQISAQNVCLWSLSHKFGRWTRALNWSYDLWLRQFIFMANIISLRTLIEIDYASEL